MRLLVLAGQRLLRRFGSDCPAWARVLRLYCSKGCAGLGRVTFGRSSGSLLKARSP